MKKRKLCRKVCRQIAICLTAGFLYLFGPAWSSAGPQEAVFEIGTKSYTVNGNPYSMDAAPFVEQGRTYVPVRYLALALNVAEKDIHWEKSTKTITLFMDNVTVKLVVGSKTITVNGQAKEMDVAPVVKDGRSYLPARYVAEAFGYRVGWDPGTRRVRLELDAPKPGTGPSTPSNSPSGSLIVTGNAVNVRNGPGLNHTVLTQVDRGDRLAVLGKVSDWYLVQLPGGRTGWIVAWYVQEDGVQDAGPADPGKIPPEEPSRGLPDGRGEPENALPPENSNPSGNEAGSSDQEKQSPAVTGLTVDTKDKITHVTVTAGGPLDYHIFPLSSPDRLVVDLTGVQPGSVPGELPVNSQAVDLLRAGWFGHDPDVTRLVFDLRAPVRYRVSLSSDQKTLELQIFIPDAGEVLRDSIIAIDPGHGGTDPGAVYNGLQEKNINWQIAQRVAALLSARGATTLLTRSGDDDVGLYERTDMANRAGADLFVSIHSNANVNPAVQGTATYILSESGGGDPGRWKESLKLANFIQSHLVGNLGLENDGVLQANFAVLRTSEMPAVLVEVAYLSNPYEAGLLTQDWFIESAAQAIVQGIVDYLNERWGTGSGN